MKSRRHLARIADLPCAVCGIQPVQAHHIRSAGLTGAGKKSSDMFALPLCPDHHEEFHREGRKYWEMCHGSQADMLADTLYRLMYD